MTTLTLDPDLITAIDAALALPCDDPGHTDHGEGPATLWVDITCPGCTFAACVALCEACLAYELPIEKVCAACLYVAAGAVFITSWRPIRGAA